jgi:hypothetical protein
METKKKAPVILMFDSKWATHAVRVSTLHFRALGGSQPPAEFFDHEQGESVNIVVPENIPFTELMSINGKKTRVTIEVLD